MIELNRIGKTQAFLLNPDLIERIDCHVDSVIRLTNGVEYVVRESGEEIVELIVEFRNRTLGALPPVVRHDPDDVDEARDGTVLELPSNREGSR